MAEAGLIPILREGIDVVKLVFFRTLKERLSKEFPHRDAHYIRKMAAALINEVFGPPNVEGPLAPFVEENQYVLQEQLASLATHVQNLRIPLTDALRIQFLCDHQEGTDSTAVLERARDLGILMTEREIPLPAGFIHLVRKIGASMKILEGP